MYICLLHVYMSVIKFLLAVFKYCVHALRRSCYKYAKICDIIMVLLQYMYLQLGTVVHEYGLTDQQHDT